MPNNRFDSLHRCSLEFSTIFAPWSRDFARRNLGSITRCNGVWGSTVPGKLETRIARALVKIRSEMHLLSTFLLGDRDRSVAASITSKSRRTVKG